MNYKSIIYEKDGAVARITLNKPDKLNSYEWVGAGEDVQEIINATCKAEEDEEVKVLIYRGSGRAFGTGQDLTKVGFVYGMGTGQPGEKKVGQRIRLHQDQRAFDAFYKIFLCEKLTIAQVHGYAREGGLYHAMMCDFFITADNASLGCPGQRLGFAGGGEPFFWFMLNHVGMKRAIDLYVTGRTITGTEAANIGLATMAVPEAKLEEEVNKMAKALSNYPRDGIAIGKATRRQIYEQQGLGASQITGTISHTLFTNLKFEPGEFNFFKERREKGAKAAFHLRDELFGALDR